MQRVLFFCLCMSMAQVHAQSDWKAFKELEKSEKTWVIFHPFKAKKAYKISKEATRVADSIANTPLLDGDLVGGQVDAFRHVYWMARLRQEIGKNAANSLGKAHERDNYRQFKKGILEDGDFPDEISSEMDLYNNEIGLSLTETGESYPRKGLIYRIVNIIQAGQLKIVKKDAIGHFVSADGEVIPIDSLKGKWINEKCLVNSNFSVQ